MHRFFDRTIGHFVLSPYPPTTSTKVKMHYYFDKEQNHYILSPLPPTKALNNRKKEETNVCSSPILDTPLTFDPTPLLPAHNVPVAQLVDAEINCSYEPAKDVCTKSLLDEEFTEVPTPILVPVLNVPPPTSSEQHVKRSPDMKQELLFQQKMMQIFIKQAFMIQQLEKNLVALSPELSIPQTSSEKLTAYLIHELRAKLKHVLPPTKSVDPHAPTSNFSEVLEWSLLPPDIQHASRHHRARGC